MCLSDGDAEQPTHAVPSERALNLSLSVSAEDPPLEGNV